MRRNPEIQFLEDRYGIVFDGCVDYRDSQEGMLAADSILMDAAPTNLLQSPLVTTSNAGVPAYLVNYMDPKLREVLVSDPKFAEICGETKFGDWTVDTLTFPIIESTGDVSTYGDLNTNGLVSANVNFEPRQIYYYQTFTRWGDKEMAKMGLAKIDWASRQNISSALTFKKFQNKVYGFGMTGLDCYGLFNDPMLQAPILAANGVWSSATGLNIYQDFMNLFTQLVNQTDGLVDEDTEMTLCLSPYGKAKLASPTQNVYGTATVLQLLKETYKNLKIISAMEYATGSTGGGQLVQLIAKEVGGQEVVTCAFTEKMRAHSIVRDTSSTYQKKSAGTGGTIIFVPAGIAQLAGM